MEIKPITLERGNGAWKAKSREARRAPAIGLAYQEAFGKLKAIMERRQRRGYFVVEEKLNGQTYMQELNSLGFSRDKVLRELGPLTDPPKRPRRSNEAK